MSYRCFEVEVTGKVAHLRLSRPDDLNTMVPEFWRDLPVVVTELSDSGAVRALVISSTGRHFSAGMDLSVFGGQLTEMDGVELGRRHAFQRENVAALQSSFSALDKARMPVLAAIQGGCIGGAVDMICACDLRYASEDAFFCIQEINIGMTADVGTLQRMPKIVPEGVVRELAYTGRRMPATRAFEVGLVQQIFSDHDALVAGTLEIAGEIAARSPLAVYGSKVALGYARDHGVVDSLDHIATWQAGMFQPADMLEAFAAKGDKRDPDFPDLPPRARGL
jgi:enoyl-CoA hydratase